MAKRVKKATVQPIEGLEPELISKEAVDGIMPVEVVEQLKALAESEAELEQERYYLARLHLAPEDNTWTVVSHGVWKRSFKGSTLYYYVLRDSLSIRFKGVKKPLWFPNAFKRLYMILHTDGFEPNMVWRSRPKNHIFPLPHKHLLSLEEQSWLKNTPPPKETLELLVGWDADWEVLYYVNTEREIPEIVPYRPFTQINGVPYATSKIISMLLYGDERGVPNPEKAEKILASYPKVNTGIPLSQLLPEQISNPLTKREQRSAAKEAIKVLRAEMEANPTRRRGIYRHKGKTLMQWMTLLRELGEKTNE